MLFFQGIDRGFEVVLGFLYDVNTRTMMVSVHQEDNTENIFDDNNNDLLMYKGLTILHLTCVFDQDHIMKHFLRFGIGMILKAGSKSKQSLVHICAWYGTFNTMNLLIRNGISVEDKNSKGFSPIHLATIRGHFACVQSLLKVLLNSSCSRNLRHFGNPKEWAKEWAKKCAHIFQVLITFL